MTLPTCDLDLLSAAVEQGATLSGEDATTAMSLIADGKASLESMVRFLLAMNTRLPVAEELAAFVTVLRARAVRVNAPNTNTICNCGTGGDGRGTINISTIAAFVIAACDVPLAKHGNRSVSSKCGSTDCLTALGVRASATAEAAERLLREENLCFMNAPDFHPAMRHVAPARAALAREGQKSVFNLLGPMLNPAGVRRQAMGVFSEAAVDLVADVLARTGTEYAYVLWGDGYDELTLTGATRVATIAGGETGVRTVTPESLGFRRVTHESLLGGGPEENARTAEEILSGRLPGAMTEMVIANAGVAVSAGLGPAVDLAEGVTMARKALEGGGAYEKLVAMREKAGSDA